MPAFDLVFALALLVAFVGGTVRGFAGVGGGLIFVPLISALYDPVRAGPTLLIIDFLLAVPMTIRALPNAHWREITPMAVAAALTTPLGVWALAALDPIVLRWGLAITVAAILAVLVSGFRYATRPGLPVTAAVGAVSGFVGGAAQISAMPAAAFWLAGPGDRHEVRRNLIVFFALASIAAAVFLLAAGLFTREVGWLALWLGPAYGIGIWLGGRRFIGATEEGYRRAAYAIIAVAAVLSAPLWDGLWR